MDDGRSEKKMKGQRKNEKRRLALDIGIGIWNTIIRCFNTNNNYCIGRFDSL